jgi:hypothetical protein
MTRAPNMTLKLKLVFDNYIQELILGDNHNMIIIKIEMIWG